MVQAKFGNENRDQGNKDIT